MKALRIVRLSGRGGVRGTMVQIKRWLLRLTAPRACRQIWKSVDGRKTRICDMTAAHLLNTIHWMRNHCNDGRRERLNFGDDNVKRARLLAGLELEARRRGLPIGQDKPRWLHMHNRRYGERQRRSDVDFDAIDRAFFNSIGPQP